MQDGIATLGLIRLFVIEGKCDMCVFSPPSFFTSRKSSYLKMEYIFPSTHVKNSPWGSSEMDFCNFPIKTDVLSCDSAWRNLISGLLRKRT